MKLIAKLSTHYPKTIIISWLVLIVLSVITISSGFGLGSLFSKLESTNLFIKGTESNQVNEELEEYFNQNNQFIYAFSGFDLSKEETFVTAQDFANLARLLIIPEAADEIDGFRLEVVDPFSYQTFPNTSSANEGFDFDDLINNEGSAQSYITQKVSEAVELRASELYQEIEDEAEAVYNNSLADNLALGYSLTYAQALAKSKAELKTLELTSELESKLDTYSNEQTELYTSSYLNLQSAKALISSSKDGYALIVTVTNVDDNSVRELDLNYWQAEISHLVEEYYSSLQTNFPEENIQYYSYSQTEISNSITDLVAHDLRVGEFIGIPLAAILMVIIFSGIIAALLPVINALCAIITGMGVLWIMTQLVEVNSFVINILSIVGVALSIDYGLLIISRYREEIQKLRTLPKLENNTSKIENSYTNISNDEHKTKQTKQSENKGNKEYTNASLDSSDFNSKLMPPRFSSKTRSKENLQDNLGILDKCYQKQAVIKTIETAGRTVLFSSITIVFSLLGLLLLQVSILTTLGISAIIVTLLSLLASLTLLPSIIVSLGNKLKFRQNLNIGKKNSRIKRFFASFNDLNKEEGVFSRIARTVQRYRWIALSLTLILLVVMALPIATLQVRSNFEDYLVEGTSIEQSYYHIQDNYESLKTAAITVIIDQPYDSSEAADLISKINDMENVQATYAQGFSLNPDSSSNERTNISVYVESDDLVSAEVINLVHSIRQLQDDYGILVGGSAASQIDFYEVLQENLGLAVSVIIIAVFVLLFLMTGSFLIPIKALIINTLSLVSTLALTSFIFSHGIFVQPSPGLELFIVCCVVAFGFGLAMDYEVFLLARIKEYYDLGYNNNRAVEKGLQHSGRIITSAACIIVAVFFGFSFGSLLPIKEIGVALAVMIVIDVTIIRMVLVPATMTLLGKWNWWAPKSMQQIAKKVNLQD